MLGIPKVVAAIKSALSPAAKQAFDDFRKRCDNWKPPGFDDEMNTRLVYYMGKQEEDLMQMLRVHYKGSYKEMVPHVHNSTKKIVNERAKVFNRLSRFPLAVNDQPLGDDSPDAKRWAEIQQATGFRLRLRQVNRWTVLMNTVCIQFGYDSAKDMPTVTIIAPQFIHVAFDENYPYDIQRAEGLLIQVASRGGLYNGDASARRYEFWSASEQEPEHYFVNEQGEQIETPDVDGGNPYRDAAGKPIIPIVAFHQQPPELGFFTDADPDLWKNNRSSNMTLTDLHHIMRWQGYTEVLLERQQGSSNAPLPAEITRGPSKSPVLPAGVKAVAIQTQAQLGEMENILTADLKRQATSNNVPPGSVLADTKLVASAEALAIDREPQGEDREEQVENYRGSLEAAFDMLRIVNNLHASAGKKLNLNAKLAWKPGAVQLPFDPQKQQDFDLIDMAENLTTPIEILAKRHGLSEVAARKMFEENQKLNKELGITGGGTPTDTLIAARNPTTAARGLLAGAANPGTGAAGGGPPAAGGGAGGAPPGAGGGAPGGKGGTL